MLNRGSNAGILTVDRDFRITALSKIAQQLTGYDQEEIFGRRCYELFCQLSFPQQCPLKQSMATGHEMDGYQVQLLNKQQNSISCLGIALPLRDSQGQIIGGIESFWPIQEDLHPAMEQAESLVDFLGAHPRVRRILDILPDVAQSKAPVLLLGERGTGKNILAKAIHQRSRRADSPWVKIDCGGYGERLLEVEIFGCCHSKVHGIEEARPGRIQLAMGGTIFIQEVDQLPQHLQIKLLRYLQDGEVEPLGGEHPVEVDARVLAACHTDLRGSVNAGTFRDDLFFRLNVFVMEIPPLRSIREAIPEIIHQLIQRYNKTADKEVRGLSAEAMDLFVGYDFPGNFRELENMIHHAYVLCKGVDIQTEHLPEGLVAANDQASFSPVRVEDGKRMEEIEREVILGALTRNQWNRKKTALELGIDRTTLWRKMRKMGWGTKVRPA